MANSNEIFKVGDILVAEWGYSMSLVNFYKVTALVGKATVELVSIGKHWVDGNGWTGYVMPNLDEEIEDTVIRKRVNGESVKITNHQFAHKWNGNKVFENHMD